MNALSPLSTLPETLAAAVGLDRAPVLVAPAGSPAQRWAESGLAMLTGHPDAAPILPARDFAGRLQLLLSTVQAFAALAGADLDLGMEVYSSRAGEMGLGRRGRISANGTARLVQAADGWLAVNLTRPEDRDSVPAWIGCGLTDEPWGAMERAARTASAAMLAEAGQLLGVPAAVVGGRKDASAMPPLRIERMAASPLPAIGGPPLVIDLSGLWAGPLCGHLLTRAGARVVKVESTRRPDGARLGPPNFYANLHMGQEAVALDFATPEGRTALHRLIARADVVIEGTRPRALEQLGIDLAAAFAANPALVWVSVTGYGRGEPWRNHVGFGDDAAAAGGLVAWDDDGAPVFVGDALADPVAGLMAAAGAFAALAAGGGFLADVALREAAAWIADAPAIDPGERGRVVGKAGDWRLSLEGGETPLTPPAQSPCAEPAPSLGAHTAAVLAELA